MANVSIYVDGSASGRANAPGGWSWIIVVDGETVSFFFGGAERTTNNIMEVEAAIRGIEAYIESNLGGNVELVSDSTYCLGIASGTYKPKKNLDICLKLRELAIKTGVVTRWVKAHTGKNKWNTKCDELAGLGKAEHTKAR